MKKIAYFAVVSTALLLVSSCNQPRYIEVPTHDTVYNALWQVDTAYIDRWHYIDRKGDTVHMVDSIIVYKAHYIHDTTRQTEIKTIPQPYPVKVEVEKPLTPIQRLLLTLGTLAAFAILAALVWVGYRLIKRIF